MPCERRRALSICAAFGLVLGLIGCQSPWLAGEPKPDVAPKYSILDSHTRESLRLVSPLLVIDDLGEIDVCIRFPDASDDSADERASIQTNATTAINDWIGLLNTDAPVGDGSVEFPPWVRRTVEVNFTCTGDQVYHLVADRSNERAYADVTNRTITLDATSMSDDRALYLVIAHEFGHLLGLGDTYYEPSIGYDVDGQPDSMMRTAAGFTEDDRAGVWNLWRFLVNGGDICGPGYRTQAQSERGDTYCILPADDPGGGSGGDSSRCEYSCDLLMLFSGECMEDEAGNSWYCDAAHCLQYVTSCAEVPADDSGGESWTCENSCSDYGVVNGECFVDGDGWSWQCFSDSCLYGVDSCGGDSGGGGGSCDYACSDSGLTNGECGYDADGWAWQCFSDGCIYGVDTCEGSSGGGGGGGSCDYACSDSGLTNGECGYDSDGWAWQCFSDGCVYGVDTCEGSSGGGGGSCEYACADYGSYVGECYYADDGWAWQCESDGCLYTVDSCEGSSGGGGGYCDYACSDYDMYSGECYYGEDGWAWACESDGCIYAYESC